MRKVLRGIDIHEHPELGIPIRVRTMSGRALDDLLRASAGSN
jgi:hypothetical protein